jgi:hypothetical protein
VNMPLGDYQEYLQSYSRRRANPAMTALPAANRSR